MLDAFARARKYPGVEFVGGRKWNGYVAQSARILSGSVLYPRAEVNMYCFLAHRVTVRENATVGMGTKIGQNTILEWEAHVGHDTKIQSFCLIAEKVRIGDHCFIGPHFTTLTDPYMDGDKRLFAPPVVGDNVRIGGGVTLLPGAYIGSGSIIGAGCVIDGEIPPNKVVYAKGVKGVVMRDITEEDTFLA